LIIQIFADRAKTREACLQVELAELEFRLPRLTHKYLDLARQRGGSYGAKGSGETRFETDRRIIEQRVQRLKSDLQEVRRQRSLQRRKREKAGVKVCALVGYTNSGKSSLLNALSGAEQDPAKAVYVENRLFATLDASSRRLKTSGKPLLMVDTVGFIRRLPHGLIDAFRSTLEEAMLADVLVVVIDASDPDAERHFSVTMQTLEELRIPDKRQEGQETPIITALNKIDKNVSTETIERLAALCPHSLPISVKTGLGLETLTQYIVSAAYPKTNSKV
jgi:GTP-binding protein HflX